MDSKNSSENVSLSDLLFRYLSLFWHWAWLLALLPALAAGSAYVQSKRTIPVYQATTLAVVNPARTTQSVDYSTMMTSEALAQTYIQTIKARPVLEGVVSHLGLAVDPETLKKSITAESVNNTQILKVSVQDTNPQQAADIANAVIAEFSDLNEKEQTSRYEGTKDSLSAQMQEINQQIEAATLTLSEVGNDSSKQAEKDQISASLSQYRQAYTYLLQSYAQVQLAETQSTSTLIQKEPAVAPKTPIRPQTMKNTVMAGMVGLLLALGLVVLIDTLDDTLRSPEEVQRLLHLPVLGVIASMKRGEDDQRAVVVNEPRSQTAEAFRSIRTNIQFTSVDHPIHTLLITSPTPADGKTTIAANLAAVFAQGERKVTLIDADLRRPRVHHYFELPNRGGMSELFVQPTLYLNGTCRPTEVKNLTVITAGSLPPNPSELLGTEKMMQILEEVHKQSELIILDTPPVLVVTDAVVLAPRVDGVLLVVRPGKTKMAACKHAIEQLERVGARVLGVVLNDVNVKGATYRYSYQGYYYHSYESHYGDDTSSHKKHPKAEAV